MDASWAQSQTPSTVYSLKLTSQLATKIVLSVTLILLGLSFLATGKKESDFGRMIIGCVIALAGLLIF